MPGDRQMRGSGEDTGEGSLVEIPSEDNGHTFGGIAV
jgi:hypothetical protein